MKIKVCYKELSDYIRKNYHKEIEMRHVSTDTIEVSFSKEINLLIIRKKMQVRLNVTVKKYENKILYIFYNYASEMKPLVNVAISLLSKKLGNNVFSVNTVSREAEIYLGNIKNMNDILYKMIINSMEFDEEGMVVDCSLL
jgi:hypothetical protein